MDWKKKTYIINMYGRSIDLVENIFFQIDSVIKIGFVISRLFRMFQDELRQP